MTAAGRATRLLAVLVILAGTLMTAAGVATWAVVRAHLADERITVSADAARYAGKPVDDPLTAYQQATTIEEHALEASAGRTYAELARDDPRRETVMNASFLRASLFTSVVSFGIAAMAAGLGVVTILIGLALLSLARRIARVADPGVSTGRHAAPDPAPAA
jgi:hypothetical protein